MLKMSLNGLRGVRFLPVSVREFFSNTYAKMGHGRLHSQFEARNTKQARMFKIPIIQRKVSNLDL